MTRGSRPSNGREPELVGREVELARVEAFAASLPDGPRALVVRGESGIGKTALWRAAVARSRGAGHRVLVARPTEEEMALDLGGLADLFEDADLDLRMLRSMDSPFTRGRLVLDELRSLARRGPVVLAIDDVQWLDPVSARTLRHALRRMESEPVGVLATARRAVDPAEQLAVPQALPQHRVDLLELGPLGLDHLRRVLAGTVASISRPTLRRIHEVSGGNPLYAIELARGLEPDDRERARPDALHLPDSLRAAIARRLDRVPASVIPLLEISSALGRSSVRELREMLPGTDVDRQLEIADARDLVVIEADLEVRVAHPLVASGVISRMSPIAQRSLHARLAEHSPDPDIRARHLALSTDEPDSAVAALLEEASERARARGAPDLAAEFARHSARLTPELEVKAARRRAIAEVVHLAGAGEVSRALTRADRLVASLPPGPDRAEVLVQRFYVGDDDLERVDRLLVQALAEAGEDERLRGRVLDILGWLRGMYRGDLPAGLRCAEEAVAISERQGDAELLMIATGHLEHMSVLSGRPRPDRMAHAVALAGDVGSPRLGGGPQAWLAKQLLWAGELDRSRRLIDAALEEDARTGRELERPYRLYDLALLECASGNLSSAREVVDLGIESARDAENGDAEWWLSYPLALVHAWLGNAEEAGAAADGLIAWGRRRGGRPGIARALSVLGVLALSQGDSEAATGKLVEGARLLEAWGFAHPGAIPILPDAVEAFSLRGDLGAAEASLRRLEAEVEALGHEWARAALERSRGILLLAAGDPDAATAALEGAVAVFDRLGHRPDAARAALWRGRALLRAGRRTLGADVLADAGARFAGMGATLWLARAEEELERAAPGRSAGRLTEPERRVAALVSDGLRNREIASELFMSVASVEAHLTRIYRKLGIRSRSELSGLMAGGAAGDDGGGSLEPGPGA